MTEQTTPTPTDGVAEPGTAESAVQSRMTIHVYKVDRYGTVTEDRGVKHYDEIGFVAIGQEFPPCICPKCRVSRRTAG